MKKLAVLLVACCMVISAIPVAGDTATSEKEIKFKNLEWGESKENVIDALTDSSMVKEKDYGFRDGMLVIPNQSVAGYDCSIICTFDYDDSFINGAYLLNEEHSNEQQYYEDYMVFLEKLNKLYGTSDPEFNWKGDLYKDEPNKRGMAIVTGDLSIGTQWYDKQGNSIILFISGDNYECQTVIVYSSSGYDVTEAENMDGL